MGNVALTDQRFSDFDAQALLELVYTAGSWLLHLAVLDWWIWAEPTNLHF